jgi:hypothetical protein
MSDLTPVLEMQKAQPVRAGLSGFAEFWLPDLDSNQGPAD